MYRKMNVIIFKKRENIKRREKMKKQAVTEFQGGGGNY